MAGTSGLVLNFCYNKDFSRSRETYSPIQAGRKGFLEFNGNPSFSVLNECLVTISQTQNQYP